MILQEVLVIAPRGPSAHEMRSDPTMLGLITRVAAVILLTAFGQGVVGSVNAAIEPCWRPSPRPGRAGCSGSGWASG